MRALLITLIVCLVSLAAAGAAAAAYLLPRPSQAECAELFHRLDRAGDRSLVDSAFGDGASETTVGAIVAEIEERGWEVWHEIAGTRQDFVRRCMVDQRRYEVRRALRELSDV